MEGSRGVRRLQFALAAFSRAPPAVWPVVVSGRLQPGAERPRRGGAGSLPPPAAVGPQARTGAVEAAVAGFAGVAVAQGSDRWTPKRRAASLGRARRRTCTPTPTASRLRSSEHPGRSLPLSCIFSPCLLVCAGLTRRPGAQMSHWHVVLIVLVLFPAVFAA